MTAAYGRPEKQPIDHDVIPGDVVESADGLAWCVANSQGEIGQHWRWVLYPGDRWGRHIFKKSVRRTEEPDLAALPWPAAAETAQIVPPWARDACVQVLAELEAIVVEQAAP